MKIKVISIDLAKNSFQVCVLSASGKVLLNKKVNRNKLLDTLRQYPPTTVAMEACYSAHPWGRAIQALDHTVVLIPPIKVKPFVQGNKNDRNDALAIAEASLRPNIRFVPVKTLEQQDVQSLMRIRERLMRHRIAVSNQLRGLLAEYHIVCPVGMAQLLKAVPSALESESLTCVAKQFINDLHSEIMLLQNRIDSTTEQMHEILRANEDYQRIQQVPGIGPVIASAVIASIGSGQQFKNGRQFAAWVGLTPKHYASGDKCHMGGISKKGCKHLRQLFIHGARAIITWVEKKNDSLSCWVKQLLLKKATNIVVVALANKIARMSWAVLAHRENYKLV